ncbi:hypothetical protein MRX96_018783 [Rhipicephalus microplus]
MQSTKNPFFLLLQLLTMLASAPCKEALTDGFHLPSKGASNWNDTARFSSWCLASRVHVVQGGPPTLLQSSSSAWNHAWQCPVFDSTTSLPVVTPIISECSSASSSPSHKFISSRHPPRDFSGHGRAAAMQSTKNPFFLLLLLLTMLASAPCKEALTDGFHLPSKGASNWNDTARFSSWCLASRLPCGSLRHVKDCVHQAKRPQHIMAVSPSCVSDLRRCGNRPLASGFCLRTRTSSLSATVDGRIQDHTSAIRCCLCRPFEVALQSSPSRCLLKHSFNCLQPRSSMGTSGGMSREVFRVE